MSYKVRIECGNCYSRNDFEVERGIPHSDADLICPNCGCAPNSQNYIVVVTNSLSAHKKENPIGM